MSADIIALLIGLVFGWFIVTMAHIMNKRVRAQEQAALYELEHATDVVSPHIVQKIDEFEAKRVQLLQKNVTVQPARIYTDTYFISGIPRFVDTHYGHFGDSYYPDGGTTYDHGAGARETRE